MVMVVSSVVSKPVVEVTGASVVFNNNSDSLGVNLGGSFSPSGVIVSSGRVIS